MTIQDELLKSFIENHHNIALIADSHTTSYRHLHMLASSICEVFAQYSVVVTS